MNANWLPAESRDRIHALSAEITHAMEVHAGQEPLPPPQPQPDHTGYIYYGMSMPVLRKIVRGFKKRLLCLPLAERLALAEMLHQSNIEELAYAGSYSLHLSAPEISPQHFNCLDHCLDHFRGWGITDDFCINVLQPVLWNYPEETLELLREWSSSENRWKRRASVVAFVRKVGASGQFVDACLERCEALVWDMDDLVRKGVGWALKDNMRGDKAKVLAYVKELRRRGITTVITLYAIRDLKGEERQAVLQIRRESKKDHAGM